MDPETHYAKYEYPNYSVNIFKADKFEFHLEKKYKPKQIIGSGAYGFVIEVEDDKAANPELKKLAIKKIERTFEHRFYAKRTLRELKILRLLTHENVLKIVSLQLPKCRKKLDDMYDLVKEIPGD